MSVHATGVGSVTFRAAYPLEPSDDEMNRERDELAIEGLLPDDAFRRILLFMADPRPLGLGCEEPAPADAEALARTLRQSPTPRPLLRWR